MPIDLSIPGDDLGRVSRSDAVIVGLEFMLTEAMAHRDARTGCLLVSVADPARYWLHPDTGEQIDRFGLQALLQAKADAAQQQLGGEARVLARVLDLVPRLPKEKQSDDTAG